MPSTGGLPPVGPENGACIILSVVIVTEQFEVIGQSTEESDAKVGEIPREWIVGAVINLEVWIRVNLWTRLTIAFNSISLRFDLTRGIIGNQLAKFCIDHIDVLTNLK